MKMYKGFDKEMKCKGFQYEVGKTYEENNAELCREGFHACKNPLDTFAYYSPADNSRYAEVELEDVSDERGDDSKRVGKRITVKAEIGIAGIVKAAVEFMKEVAGGSATTDEGEDSARIGSSGHYAQIGSSGDYAQIGSSGYYARIGSSGYYAQIGSSGDYARIGSSGYYAPIGSSGDYARIGSSGDYAQIGSSGETSVVAAIGPHSVVSAAKGSWITLAEYTNDMQNRLVPICVKTEYVDGERIKADTTYKLEGGEFVEVTE